MWTFFFLSLDFFIEIQTLAEESKRKKNQILVCLRSHFSASDDDVDCLGIAL